MSGDTVLVGLYGTLTVHANGSYSYAPNAAAINALTAPTTDVFDVQVSDGIAPAAATTLTVNITGANDAPTITAEVATPPLVDTAALDTFAAGDRPAGRCRRRCRCEPELPDRRPGPGRSGDTVLVGLYGTLTVHANGSYSYAPNAAAINALTAPTTDVFDVQVSDGSLTAVRPR